MSDTERDPAPQSDELSEETLESVSGGVYDDCIGGWPTKDTKPVYPPIRLPPIDSPPYLPPQIDISK